MYWRLESGHRTITKTLQLSPRHVFGLHKSSIAFFYCHSTKKPFQSLMAECDCLPPLIKGHHASRHTLSLNAPCIPCSGFWVPISTYVNRQNTPLHTHLVQQIRFYYHVHHTNISSVTHKCHDCRIGKAFVCFDCLKGEKGSFWNRHKAKAYKNCVTFI